MKKVYLLGSVLLSGLALNAQNIANSPLVAAAKNTQTVAKKANHAPVAKAEGDVLWSHDFTVDTDWTFTGGAGHTDGDWAVLNAVPQSLVDQSIAGYGFPTAMNSVSGGNFAFINSDAAGNAGTQDAYFEFNGTIDLSATAPGTALYCEFTNIYRHYYETYSIEVSMDGGANWVEFIANPPEEVAVNTNSTDPEEELINITSANLAGSANVKLRLHYVGAWDWFWGVDDIKITEAYANDGKMISTTMSTDPATSMGNDYYIVPTSQTDFPGHIFRTVANNNGYATQTEFRAHAVSTGYDELSGPGEVYPAGLPMGETDTFNITNPFNPTAGTYDVTVSTDLGSNVDSYSVNDAVTFENLVVGGEEFGRDNGVYSSSLSGFSGTGNEILGWYNYMEIFNTYSLGSIKTFLPSAQSSTFVTDYVHASVEVTTDGGASWIEVAVTEGYDVTSSDFDAWLSLNIDGGAMDLEPGMYRVIFHRLENGDNTLRLAMAQASPEGTVGGVKSDGTGDAISLSDPNAIMMRLSTFTDFSVSSADLVNNLSVYPNPAVNEAKVSFTLANAANVTINVTDLTGKVVYTNEMGSVNAGSQKVAINTAALNNGVYMVNFIANGDVATQKLVVRK
jgi:hypothetical protein